ncbi:hypothetical protein V865_001723 [Kwoniella europaea PYCC6329]|uniref:RING-type domain-containing protein n=1 Tax=Kwoniella europaea PYCC6329 TaxID=1423913 RepID=A0AAX4KD72_9TREE
MASSGPNSSQTGDSTLSGRDTPSSGERRSRRASIRSAIGAIQKFKQSWISIMVLKGGISLGQVIALITLLILASTLSSPLYPDQRQSTPSEACPRPQYFQAWMGVQIGRLVVCWLNSVWICVRRRRAEDRGGDVEDSQRQNIEERRIPSQTGSAHHTLQRHITPSSSTSTIFQTPLSHHPHRDESPETIYISTYTSTPSLFNPSPPEENTRSKVSRTTQPPDDSNTSPRMDVHIIDRTNTHNIDDENRIDHGDNNNIRAARSLVNSPETINEGFDQADSLGKYMDSIAPKLSSFLGLLSFVLFILGNILLFKPLPSDDMSCYNASPMLWWGVMTVTGVGWVLLAQMILVIVVVGIGGTVLMAILRNFGITLPSSSSQSPSNRNPQPEPLTLIELNTLQYVCYLPTSTIDIQKESLPHPPIYLKEDQITCAICQENFVPPQQGREALAEWLRVLGCGHVYHAKCIDEWLLRGAASCPFCNRSVRDMISPSDGNHASGVESRTRRPSVLGRWMGKES